MRLFKSQSIFRKVTSRDIDLTNRPFSEIWWWE